MHSRTTDRDIDHFLPWNWEDKLQHTIMLEHLGWLQVSAISNLTTAAEFWAGWFILLQLVNCFTLSQVHLQGRCDITCYIRPLQNAALCHQCSGCQQWHMKVSVNIFFWFTLTWAINTFKKLAAGSTERPSPSTPWLTLARVVERNEGMVQTKLS